MKPSLTKNNPYAPYLLLLIISLKKKGNKIMKTVNHLQKAKEIGGTNSTAPRAIIVFVDMNTG